VGPGGPLVAGLSPSEQRRHPLSSSIAFGRWLPEKRPPRSAHAHTLTMTMPRHNDSPEPQYDWHGLCVKVRWCALSPATPPCGTGRAILRKGAAVLPAPRPGVCSTHSRTPPHPPSLPTYSTRLRSLLLSAIRPLGSFIPAFLCVFGWSRHHVPYPPGWAILLPDTLWASAAGHHIRHHR